MNGRPAKVDPVEVEATIARLQRGADHFLDMTWPGGGPPIRIRLLTRSERQQRFAEAHRRFAELGLRTDDLYSGEEFAAEQITQILAVAITDPARPIAGTRAMCEPYFANAGKCRDGMTDDENAALWDAYVALERESNPTVGGGITPEMIAQVAEAQKKRDPDLLRGIAPSSLRTLLATTDGPPSTSPSGKSGSGDSLATDDSPPP